MCIIIHLLVICHHNNTMFELHLYIIIHLYSTATKLCYEFLTLLGIIIYCYMNITQKTLN